VSFQSGAFVGNLAEVARIANEDETAAANDQDAAIAGESAQIGDVYHIGNSQGIDPFRGERACKSFAARRGGVSHAFIPESRKIGSEVQSTKKGADLEDDTEICVLIVRID
jgi:hypothetical protein